MSTKLSLDRIEAMDNDEIFRRLRALNNVIKTRRARKESTREEEEDYCYLFREAEDRKRFSS